MLSFYLTFWQGNSQPSAERKSRGEQRRGRECSKAVSWICVPVCTPLFCEHVLWELDSMDATDQGYMKMKRWRPVWPLYLFTSSVVQFQWCLKWHFFFSIGSHWKIFVASSVTVILYFTYALSSVLAFFFFTTAPSWMSPCSSVLNGRCWKPVSRKWREVVSVLLETKMVSPHGQRRCQWVGREKWRRGPWPTSGEQRNRQKNTIQIRT